MIYRPLRNKGSFLGAKVTFTPIELLIIKHALKVYTKDNKAHPKDRIIAQCLLNDMKETEEEFLANEIN